jgi:hypothetical protein
MQFGAVVTCGLTAAEEIGFSYLFVIIFSD